MLPFALIAAGMLALWLLPAVRRGLAVDVAKSAATGFLAAIGIFLVLRGRVLLGGAMVGAAVLIATWHRVRGIAGRSPPLAAMSVEEALAVLGLKAGASAEEIRSAHRALIQKLHPDRGGTAYLAAKLNQARDVLLRQAK